MYRCDFLGVNGGFERLENSDVQEAFATLLIDLVFLDNNPVICLSSRTWYGQSGEFAVEMG